MRCNKAFNVVRLSNYESGKFSNQESAVRGLALFYASEMAAKIVGDKGRIVHEVAPTRKAGKKKP